MNMKVILSRHKPTIEKVISQNGNDVLRVILTLQEIPEGYDGGLQAHREYYGEEALAIVQEYGTPEQIEIAETISNKCHQAFVDKRVENALKVLGIRSPDELKLVREIKITTHHCGYNCNDGGEYGFWQKIEIFQNPEGDLFSLKTYHTSCDGFTHCKWCDSFGNQYHTTCGCDDVEWFENLEPLNREIGNIIWDIIPNNIDNSGHEPELSEEGGCKICHPFTR